MIVLAWLLAGLVVLMILGVLVNAARCPTRHWRRGRCVKPAGHRGDHLAQGHVWSTTGIRRHLLR